MRWSTLSTVGLATVLVSSSSSVLAQSVQGEPTLGATSIPVTVLPTDDDTATVIAQAGEPTSVYARQDAGTTNGVGVVAGSTAGETTYNDGLYTPWTPSTDVVVSQTVTSDNVQSSVYLQPTSSVAVVTSETADLLTSTSVTTPAAATTSSTVASSTSSSSSAMLTSSTTSFASVASTSSTPATLSSSTSSSSSSSSTSTSSSTSSASSSTSSASALSDAANISTSKSSKMVVEVLPVALSLGVLALLLAILLLALWRRRVRKRRVLESRRYTDAEKGFEHDDDEEEKQPWTTFGRNSRYDDIEGAAGVGAGVGVGAGYRYAEERDEGERGWQWGAQQAAPAQNPLRQSRGPLPMTPQGHVASTVQRQDTMQSLHEDLDAMIAQSRTGYEANHVSQQQNTLTRAASAIYSSLSGQSKRFGSKTSSRSAYSVADGKGRWNEHGVWETDIEEEYLPQSPQGKKGSDGATEEGQERPLLACVDETPRKKGYSTYSPPGTPTRSGTPGRYGTDTDDTDLTVHAGSEMMAHTLSDQTHSPARRFTLRDNPVPAFSPSSVASPNRSRSKTMSENGYDSPSLYSPTTTAHGAFSPPMSLMPGRSPALGSRPVSPAIQANPYYQAYSKPSNTLTQSTQSGTTYSLTGMAGMLYSGDESKAKNNLTNLPASRPRRQSTLSKYKPVVAGSPDSHGATAADSEDSPHRAVSRVIRQSRQRGSSITSGSGSSEASHSASPWNQRVRSQLRESNSSGSSINELLHNVLGPARSPA